MKRPHFELPRLLASLCLIGTSALTACASDDGTTDDAASGGSTASGGGTGSGGDTATGGMSAGDGGGTAADPNELPAEITLAGVEAFLAAGTYQNAPWVGDAAARPPGASGNAHGESMRVFFNTAAAATKTRNDSSLPAETGSMIVKELYEAGAVVGHAVSIKAREGMGWSTWTYYCNAPEGSTLCSGEVETYPIFDEGPAEGCGFCHAEVPIADLPQ